jgi:hypothetical protein
MHTNSQHLSTPLKASIPFRPFGISYDDLPAFHAAYFMLVLIFAGIFNLGFFAVLIVAHIILDYYKYYSVLCNRRISATYAVLRENLPDLALFFLALSSLVYLHPSLPLIAALSGPRMTHVVIVRGLAVWLPKLTILHHSMRIAFHTSQYLHMPNARLQKSWTITDYIYLSRILLSFCFLAAAPFMLHIDVAQMQEILMNQLIPWKF